MRFVSKQRLEQNVAGTDMEKMISIKENDVKILIKGVKDMMEIYSMRDNMSYRRCGFCRAAEDYRGNLTHNYFCDGRIILAKLEEAQPVPTMRSMGVLRIDQMLRLDEMDPIEGLTAIRWLVNRKNHNMETRTILRLVRKLKEKMEIPV